MPRYIDADALMKEFRDFVRRSNNSDFAPDPTWNDAVSLVGSAPTADVVERKKGKLITVFIEYPNKTGVLSECPLCGQRFKDKTYYCPNCGAQMEV